MGIWGLSSGKQTVGQSHKHCIQGYDDGAQRCPMLPPPLPLGQHTLSLSETHKWGAEMQVFPSLEIHFPARRFKFGAGFLSLWHRGPRTIFMILFYDSPVPGHSRELPGHTVPLPWLLFLRPCTICAASCCMATAGKIRTPIEIPAIERMGVVGWGSRWGWGTPNTPSLSRAGGRSIPARGIWGRESPLQGWEREKKKIKRRTLRLIHPEKKPFM